ncbi:MAG TPA: large conductance mechanosensitive channel protein MscL [Candidatus Baltobacteraceae bacterium]|jgi:large conductance mechanosensitive channel|nr:large conductance mechanosensitive channel protein MscL [Candidatus Baltobacteraceae bacterium]
MSGFLAFLKRGNVVDLAVAVVIGGAFTAIVNALVKDLVTPLIAALFTKPDFSAIAFTINQSRFSIGDFINALVSFVIIAAVVYYAIVLPITHLSRHLEKPVEATTRECPECLSEIPIAAKRCKFCTAVVASG